MVLAAGLLAAGPAILQAEAQFQSGGVDHPGDWHVGEGLKQGDLFSYRMCHVDYRECADFRMDIWMEGDVQTGTETKWRAQVVVYDGNKVIKGNMDLGKIAPEPTGGTVELASYRSAFKSSVVWLSAFANSDEPKQFAAPSWGKIGNIGGEQILPQELITDGIVTPGGTFDEVVQVGWRTGGSTSRIFVVDEFPFPIRASTWTHVSEGIPPQEYKFELLSYQENVQENPFESVQATADELAGLGCPSHDRFATTVKKATVGFKYQLHVFYGPEFPVDGCPMKWQVKFISKFDETEFLNQVHYDLLVLNKDGTVARSVAHDEGRQFLFSPSGQALFEMTVKEGPGTTDYVVYVYGLSPEFIVPDVEPDWVVVPVTISAAEGDAGMIPTVRAEPAPVTEIPPWVKLSAGFWVEGSTPDAEFVTSIEFLIKEGIIVVPSTDRSVYSEAGIPEWFKGTTSFWIDGTSTDAEYASSIQYLIEQGVIVLS
ncbi:secreted periplasmic Zn-dependent protease [Cenarchaeum symbiosum A]|uniref:Secreted periplasmic Zn-dependent protease n=1 Tax=Cenarchaeum symbiosum (strain A) TaxID=414004 RepID=A0RWQ5_CENSY|nr:secreted periplasmic Zn-dependent protease [Cenarchaeum symbiosum A]